MTSLAPEPVDRAVLEAVRAPFAAYAARTGARWTDAPTLLPLSLLLDLAGEGMRARLYTALAEGGEELALRPDFTVSLARAVAAGAKTGAGGEGRWLYEGPAYRVAPAGSGRPSEFLQLGVEVVGSSADPSLEDAEVAALAWRAAAAGGRRDLSVRFGDVGLFAAFLQALGLPEGVRARLAATFASGRSVTSELDRLAEGAPSARPLETGRESRLPRLLGDLPEAEAAAVLEELWALAGIQPVGGRGAAEIVHRLAQRAEAERGPRLSPAERALVERYLAVSGAPEAALDGVQDLAHAAAGGLDPLIEGWRRRLFALADGGVPAATLTLDCGFIRPFGYYTGVLWEVRSAALPSDAPVAAGGRYDGLLQRLGAPSAPAVGCMVRPGRAGGAA